jgi:hypothetical protein
VEILAAAERIAGRSAVERRFQIDPRDRSFRLQLFEGEFK